MNEQMELKFGNEVVKIDGPFSAVVDILFSLRNNGSNPLIRYPDRGGGWTAWLPMMEGNETFRKAA